MNMPRSVIATAIGLALAFGSSGGSAALFSLSWTGANGYGMTGQFSFADSLLGTGVIDETQIETFSIEGFLNGAALGSFTLDPSSPPTFWNVNFDTDLLAFLVGGNSTSGTGQQWNQSGNTGRGCGNPGFGFNSGDFSQDICVDNNFVSASSVPPNTPIHVERLHVPLPSSLLLLLGGISCLSLVRARN